MAARIIQFMHPGSEPDFPKDGRLRWNMAPDHRRCFLRARGTSLLAGDGKEYKGDLVFWGEWEGLGAAVALSEKNEPKMVVTPHSTDCPTSGTPQNTDPFVFGANFFYSCCRQEGSPMLRALDRGSLVLFGSRVKGCFVLDTVFVVERRLEYDPRLGSQALPNEHLPREFVQAVLRPLKRGCSGSEKSIDDHDKLTLYWGATPERPVDGMFSFSAALPCDEGLSSGFQRPPLKARFINGKLGRGIRDCTGHTKLSIPEAWQSVVTEVLSRDGRSQQLQLGVHFDLPAPFTGFRSRKSM
jgi:hypothetical protein